MDPRQAFIKAQQRLLNRYNVEAQSHFIEVPSIKGKAHALVTGNGPAVVMVNGIGTPAAMFAPLIAELNGFQIFAVDLPAYGLTDTTKEFTKNLKRNAIDFLREVIEELGLQRPAFMANSMGSLWTSWLALERPEKVAAMVHLGCPAIILDTSAPFPMRLLSVKPLGRLMTWLQPPSKKQVEDLSKMVNEYPLVDELSDLLLATERLPKFRQTFLSTLNTLLRLGGNRPEMSLSAEQLANIKHPTLFFWGKNDPFGGPEIGKRVVEAMPNAELHILEGGHAPWLSQAKSIGPKASSFMRESS